MKTRGFLLTFWLIFRFGVPGVTAQATYGDNAEAGRYYDVGDARIYYEVYGEGKPVVLLHGGLFGYIAEFEFLIPRLARSHQVIAIGTRGHGRSEIGTRAFTYEQLADDAWKVIRSITQDSVLVIGFSDGGITGYNLASKHPELVRKLVAMGAPRRPSDRVADLTDDGRVTASRIESISPGFAAARKKLMPDAGRWDEFLGKLEGLWQLRDFIPDKALQQLKCPVLLIAGDRDGSLKTEKLLETYRLLPNAELAVIPGCGHVILECSPGAVWTAIFPFTD